MLDIGIKHNLSAPSHSQGNGQAEATNKTLLGILKKCLTDAGKIWVKQLHAVLEAYHTTPKHLIRLFAFHLAYGSEAVLPTELMVTNKKC